MNNIIIKPFNTIKSVNGQTTEHFVNQDKIIKLRKYLNNNGFKYNWQEISPNTEFNLNKISFTRLNKLKQYDLVSTIADFNDCSDTNECDHLLNEE